MSSGGFRFSSNNSKWSSVPEHCTSVLRSKVSVTVNDHHRLRLAEMGRHHLIKLVSGALPVKILVLKIKFHHHCLKFSLLDLIDMDNQKKDLVLTAQE